MCCGLCLVEYAEKEKMSEQQEHTQGDNVVLTFCLPCAYQSFPKMTVMQGSQAILDCGQPTTTLNSGVHIEKSLDQSKNRRQVAPKSKPNQIPHLFCKHIGVSETRLFGLGSTPYPHSQLNFSNHCPFVHSKYCLKILASNLNGIP